jgi:nucleotide-binding universal stress UspA family protein
MKILLAIDDSPFTEASVKTLIAQFDPAKTEVRVIHVVEPISVSAVPQMDPQYYPELREQVKEAQAMVDRVAKKLQGAGFRLTTAVETGDPRSMIVDAAAAWKPDLIMLGSHGRKGLSRFLLGSVSEAVARHAPCSVEIVRIPAAS